MSERIRTVEYDPGWGWITRSPWDGHEIGGGGFRWRTRDVARTVVLESRLLDRPTVDVSTVQVTERNDG